MASYIYTAATVITLETNIWNANMTILQNTMYLRGLNYPTKHKLVEIGPSYDSTTDAYYVIHQFNSNTSI